MTRPVSWRHRASWLVMWTLSIAVPWAATSWLGHQSQPWAIDLTGPAFASALAWTYVVAWSLATRWADNRRVVLFRAAAVTLSLALGLLVLEAPAMVGALDYGRLRGAMTGDWSGPAIEFIYDPELSFRRPANTRWAGHPRSDMAQAFNLPIRAGHQLTFSTDSRGFRNPVALDHADIALLGDSYIEGSYVSDEETIAVRLRELTGRAVVNLGISGYGSLQELKVFEKTALPLGPRTVAWFFFEGNDLDDDQNFENTMAYERGVRTPPEPIPASVKWRGFVERSFTSNAYLQLRELTDRWVPNGISSFGWFRDGGGTMHRVYFFNFYATRVFGDYEQRRFEATKTAFRQGNAIARERGIKLVAFFIPMKFRVYGDFCTYPAGSPCPQWRPWDLETRFAEFCRDAGIEFVSLTEPMRRAAADGDVVYAPEDSHWNAAGHALVAKVVAAHLDVSR